MPLQFFPGLMGYDENTIARTAAAVTYTSTTIAAGATIGVYTTTPVQFIAATTSDTTMIKVWNNVSCANSAARGDVVLDIMAGAAGSEYPIIQGLIFGGRNAYSSYSIPISIPAGTRISGRTAAGVLSRSLTWSIDLFHSDRQPNALPKRWVSYGMSTASGIGAYGTAITAGSTNTFSAWTALTASTTYAHDYWLPMAGVGVATAITALNYRIQFAVASTTDAATMVTNGTGVFEGPWLTGSTAEQMGQFDTATNPITVGIEDMIFASRPAGSAVSARVMCSGAAVAGATTCAILAAVI